MKKWRYSKIFKPVTCTGYLVKCKKFDTSIQVNPEDNTFTVVHDNGDVCEGLKDIKLDRTYYRMKQERFRGMYVGTRIVITEAEVTRSIDKYGVQHYTKYAKNAVECAIVYYAPNRKHLVPLDCIEEE